SAGALAEHEGGERREPRGVAVEARAAGDLQRQLHQRQVTLFHHAECGAVAQPAGGDGGYGEWCRCRERGGTRASEVLRGGGRGERDRGECERHGAQSEVLHRAVHWATLRVAASSVLPCGTTLSVTRPPVRYCRTTRCTSAAVTAWYRSRSAWKKSGSPVA